VHGHDLTVAREIKLTDAILGTTLPIPTLDGRELSLKIPSGTKHNTKMRLAGYGLPHMNGSGRGDLYARILIEIPGKLSDAQRDLVTKLAETGL